ncbi:hypothetical protein [Labrys wisconsinensis]|uniref:Uncharacterized protein n=1 Tax=Labrys wisconsinensis TaxID=425677 RepID=A0ABU0J5S4_9HYPH|nr:hypothetical protein [Labrys wisconsinensis]MDQ0469608.1 hypothetical protein [Labrys wisconsinensis]
MQMIYFNRQRRDIILGGLSNVILYTSRGSAETLSLKIEGQPNQVSLFNRPETLAKAKKIGTPIPVLVLLRSSPRVSVIGSQSPSFALYEDNRLIYWADQRYKSVELSENERSNLLQTLNFSSLANLNGGYAGSDSTDQPETTILVYGWKNPFFISIYGSLDSRSVRSKIPDAVINAYDTLLSFSHPRAEEWLPADIEVMIWPYEYAPEPSIEWPSHWPGLDDRNTVKRGDGYSIFMPSAELQALQIFLGSQRPRGAVEIGKKKWSVGVRIPFPHENLWMGRSTD